MHVKRNECRAAATSIAPRDDNNFQSTGVTQSAEDPTLLSTTFDGGVIEGLNNKAKVTMRKAYGFRTFAMIEIALYHALGKLPEPELAHDFY